MCRIELGGKRIHTERLYAFELFDTVEGFARVLWSNHILNKGNSIDCVGKDMIFFCYYISFTVGREFESDFIIRIDNSWMMIILFCKESYLS